MNSIRFRDLILLLGIFGFISPLGAGPSTGVQTIEGGPVSAGVQNPGPAVPPNPAAAASSDSARSGGNRGSSLQGGDYSGRDGVSGPASGQSAAAGSGRVREKVTEVDARALTTSASDGKFQQSLLDVGLKSDPKSAKGSTSAVASGDVGKEQKSASARADQKSSSTQNPTEKH